MGFADRGVKEGGAWSEGGKHATPPRQPKGGRVGERADRLSGTPALTERNGRLCVGRLGSARGAPAWLKTRYCRCSRHEAMHASRVAGKFFSLNEVSKRVAIQGGFHKLNIVSLIKYHISLIIKTITL